MFENFPKTRTALPEKFQRLYSQQYEKNRKGETPAASLAQRVESWLHKQVARHGTARDGAPLATLELGAGTLNQLAYEAPSPAYDIVEPFTSLFERSPLLSRVRRVYGDIAEIDLDNRYDRIISIAALEHICNLPEVVARGGLLLAQGGVFQASIPSEGTPLWTLGWKLTTGLEFRLKHGLDYGVLMKHEHVNTADEIEEVVGHFFRDVSCKVFGVSRGLSLYRYYECRDPDLDRCARHGRGADT